MGLRRYLSLLVLAIVGIGLLPATPAAEEARLTPESLAGSTVHTGDCYRSGQVQEPAFEVYNFSQDSEWVEEVELTFPATWVVSCQKQDPVDSCGYDVSFGCSVSGSRVSYSGGPDPIHDGCSWGFGVQVTVPAGITGTQVLDWRLVGDEWGDAPHVAVGKIDVYNCDDLGWLRGTVRDFEAGGAEPACSEPIVHIQSMDIDVPVAADGAYGPVTLPVDVYTVTAAAPGYSEEMAVVRVGVGMTTTQDLDLRRPVLAVSPSDFVSVTVAAGEVTTHTLIISNQGHLPLDFEVVEVDPGAAVRSLDIPAFQTTWLAGEVEIDPQLLNRLSDRQAADFFVEMRLQASLDAAYAIRSWADRGQYVFQSLRNANTAQAPVIAYAQEQGLDYRTFLVNNTVLIRYGTLQNVRALASMPEVKTIRANRLHKLEQPVEAAEPESWGWNLDRLDPDAGQFGMQAVQVWQEYGVRGECEGCGYGGEDNVVVASIDTGAYYEHEALVRQYRGTVGNGTFDHDYDWYAPTISATLACDGAASAPCDWHNHGSGVTGIMVGETEDQVEQIGIAPGAQWISCMGCDTPPNECSEEALLACADWIAAPTKLDGSDPDPSQRPHIVNNSWGDAGCDPWYDGAIAVWRAAGIFPAFSAGNSAGCGTVGSPGDSPHAFGTAAHSWTGYNLYAGGPSCFFPTPSCDPHAHQIAPHVNAPTFGRTSGKSQDAYFLLSGTSGASPHAAGCVGLMWAANPLLIGDIETTFTILEQSADRSSTQLWAEGDCGKPACAGDEPYPNYEYGWGYLDCHAAVAAALGVRTDLEWVSVEPVSGTVDIQDSSSIELVFRCSESRMYAGAVRVLHTDPCQAPVELPIELACEGGIYRYFLPFFTGCRPGNEFPPCTGHTSP
ncbi:MAG: S8 family serine peptidase [Anaerolineae bacterium]|jgi:hypothetical protein